MNAGGAGLLGQLPQQVLELRLVFPRRPAEAFEYSATSGPQKLPPSSNSTMKKPPASWTWARTWPSRCVFPDPA